MSTTDQSIPPALHKSYWSRRAMYIQASEYDSANNAAAEIHFGPGSFYITEHEHPRYAVFDTPEMQAAMVAIANHALPDDDPRKLRAWDEAVINGAASALIEAGIEYPHLDALLLAARKLAAFLQPE